MNDKKKIRHKNSNIQPGRKKKTAFLEKKNNKKKECVKQSIYIANVTRALFFACVCSCTFREVKTILKHRNGNKIQ